MQRMKRIIFVAVATLSGCGGSGDGSQSTPVEAPLAGAYDARIADLDQSGVLLIGESGPAVYSSREYVGFVTIQKSANTATGALQLLDHPIDDLNNEFPSAKDAGLSKQLSLSSGSSGTWSGSSTTLTPRSVSTPSIASLFRNWRFRNLYRFGGSTFLDYSVDIDITTSGEFTGSDTNGCVFTGQMSLGSGSTLYAARINASNCGATNSYIDNYSYDGFGYVSENPTALTIVAINSAAHAGLALRLSPRP